MNKQGLRPIAICVMVANGFPLLAQQTAPPATLAAARTSRPLASAAAQSGGQSLAPVTPRAFAVIEGTVADARDNPIPRASVRLRDVRMGRVSDSKRADEVGRFAFRGIDPGNFVVELLSDRSNNVLAASPMVSVNAGDSATTLVKLPTQRGSLTGFVAPIAAVVLGTAAAAGVLSVRSSNCVSPPCEN